MHEETEEARLVCEPCLTQPLVQAEPVQPSTSVASIPDQGLEILTSNTSGAEHRIVVLVIILSQYSITIIPIAFIPH